MNEFFSKRFEQIVHSSTEKVRGTLEKFAKDEGYIIAYRQTSPEGVIQIYVLDERPDDMSGVLAVANKAKQELFLKQFLALDGVVKENQAQLVEEFADQAFIEIEPRKEILD